MNDCGMLCFQHLLIEGPNAADSKQSYVDYYMLADAFNDGEEEEEELEEKSSKNKKRKQNSESSLKYKKKKMVSTADKLESDSD